MKRVCAIVLYMLMYLSVAAGERWAIVVGIGEYPNGAGWRKINGDNDIGIIMPMLCRFGFPSSHINILQNEEATKQNIKNAVMELLPKLKSSDTFYFHFSGHGQLITDLDGDEEDGWDEAIIPYDARPSYDPDGYKGENHIVDDELNGWLLDVRRKVGPEGKILVVLDACHSGGGSRDEDEDVTVRGTADRFEIKSAAPKGPSAQRAVEWVCISACKSDQRNHEYKTDNGRQYGRLSWVLSRGLAPDMRAGELERLINVQYKSLPLTPSPQTAEMDCRLDMMNKPVL